MNSNITNEASGPSERAIPSGALASLRRRVLSSVIDDVLTGIPLVGTIVGIANLSLFRPGHYCRLISCSPAYHALQRECLRLFPLVCPRVHFAPERSSPWTWLLLKAAGLKGTGKK